ncbi:hypothetical protein F444_16227 [Phytophthora nicotianae P1976]|uniref:Uncharacterized protein n=1 Tax=Phytophthora nicotianae P1976 TaxID=1317066 RepID=A0A080ZJ80_PHYNI|nr:hypothetical protein F444_16227 [Phytophthora nicotianae P1976]
MRGLTVDVQLQDAESRMSCLLANFYSTVDGVNTESIIHEDPKSVVGYLVNALRPTAFHSAIQDSLERPAGKPLKKDVSMFLRWLRPQMEEFMKYETHILAAQHGVSNAVSQQPQKRKPSRRHGGKPDQQRTDGRHQSPGASADSTRTTGVRTKNNAPSSTLAREQGVCNGVTRVYTWCVPHMGTEYPKS